MNSAFEQMELPLEWAPQQCHVCGRPFSWTGPNSKGVDQQWHRAFEETKRGARCLDRAACRKAAA